jgi:AcrR family transcriptional regulator
VAPTTATTIGFFDTTRSSGQDPALLAGIGRTLRPPKPAARGATGRLDSEYGACFNPTPMTEDAETRPAGAAEPPDEEPTRLAASQVRRLRRIVDAASKLAEQGGFEAVRLRDVAEASGVALGTLYRYFRGKEDILVFLLAEEMDRLEQALTDRPPRGDTPRERVAAVFGLATRGLTGRPHFARALLRAVSAGDPETTEKVAAFHLRVGKLVLDALRGEDATGARQEAADERLRNAAIVLQQVWFASLVGWTGGLHDPKTVLAQVDEAAALLLEG